MCSALLGLMFFLAFKNQSPKCSSRFFANRFGVQNILIIVAISLLGLISLREVYQSFYKHPFLIGQDCFLHKPLTHDRWTSGIYMLNFPAGTQGVMVPLKIERPNLKIKPLTIDIDILNLRNDSFASSSKSWSQSKQDEITVALPLGKVLRSELIARMRLSSCYTPRNLGVSSDGRILGVQVGTSTLF